MCFAGAVYLIEKSGLFKKTFRIYKEALSYLFKQKIKSYFIWVLLLIVMSALEEILFRFFIQEFLGAGVIITSVIFGLCHFITLPYFFFALCAGLMLGFQYEMTGNLAYSIITHITVNLISGTRAYIKYGAGSLHLTIFSSFLKKPLAFKKILKFK